MKINLLVFLLNTCCFLPEGLFSLSFFWLCTPMNQHLLTLWNAMLKLLMNWIALYIYISFRASQCDFAQICYFTTLNNGTIHKIEYLNNISILIVLVSCNLLVVWRPLSALILTSSCQKTCWSHLYSGAAWWERFLKLFHFGKLYAIN